MGVKITLWKLILDQKHKLEIFSSSFIWLKQKIYLALLLGVIVLSTFHFSKNSFSNFSKLEDWLKQNFYLALLLGVIVPSTFHFSKNSFSNFSKLEDWLKWKNLLRSGKVWNPQFGGKSIFSFFKECKVVTDVGGRGRGGGLRRSGVETFYV